MESAFPANEFGRYGVYKVFSSHHKIWWKKTNKWSIFCSCSAKIFLKKVSFTHDKSSIFTIKTQPNEHCLSTIESTLCVLEQLNKHHIEDIKSSYLEDFLNPFKKMVAYQISCTDEDKKYVRFKKNSSYE